MFENMIFTFTISPVLVFIPIILCVAAVTVIGLISLIGGLTSHEPLLWGWGIPFTIIGVIAIFCLIQLIIYMGGV